MPRVPSLVSTAEVQSGACLLRSPLKAPLTAWAGMGEHGRAWASSLSPIPSHALPDRPADGQQQGTRNEERGTRSKERRPACATLLLTRRVASSWAPAHQVVRAADDLAHARLPSFRSSCLPSLRSPLPLIAPQARRQRYGSRRMLSHRSARPGLAGARLGQARPLARCIFPRLPKPSASK
jgi:hypothetical protein